MTGAGHYREAGRLAGEAKLASDEPRNTIWTFDEAIRAAQVHATLALAAAAVPVAALDAAQLDTVLDALDDAADYRQLRSPASCADCRTADPGRCDDHGRDADLTRRYDALSRQLRQETR